MHMTRQDIEDERKLIAQVAEHVRKFAPYVTGSEGYTQAIMVAGVEAKLVAALEKDADSDFIDTRISLLEAKHQTWQKRKAALEPRSKALNTRRKAQRDAKRAERFRCN